MLRAVAEAQIASSKLGLDNELRLRTLAAAVETVYIVPSENQAINAMKAAAAAYETAVKDNKGHAHGAPDFWKLKVLLQVICADGALAAHTKLAPLVTAGFPQDTLFGIASSCILRQCSDEHSHSGKTVVVIQFLPCESGMVVKGACDEYFAKHSGELRRGRAARGALARASQTKLDNLHAAMKKK